METRRYRPLDVRRTLRTNVVLVPAESVAMTFSVATALSRPSSILAACLVGFSCSVTRS